MIDGKLNPRVKPVLRFASRMLDALRKSPTVFREKGYRFYFFSREEPRAHVHAQHAAGEAKFWIQPIVALHANYGLKPKQVAEAQKLVEEHLDEIRHAWAKHFPG